jgi:hypothetical protein
LWERWIFHQVLYGKRESPLLLNRGLLGLGRSTMVDRYLERLMISRGGTPRASDNFLIVRGCALPPDVSSFHKVVRLRPGVRFTPRAG